MTNRCAWSKVPFVAIAALTLSCSADTGAISERHLESWLTAYGVAWEGRNPALVAALFTEDATYQETPYAEPFNGSEGISDYWASVTVDQADITFEFETLSISGNTGVAQWSARFRSISGDVPVELNGVFVLEFADENLVSSLREWWHVR